MQDFIKMSFSEIKISKITYKIPNIIKCSKNKKQNCEKFFFNKVIYIM